jgi:indolepyruvate ferredoxin oxidoreductase alpha subunit
MEKIETELEEALELSEGGVFSTLIIEGVCIHEIDSKGLIRKIEFDYDKCKYCDLCDICPGIVLDETKTPHFTNLCTNCGMGEPICIQRCPFDAIVYMNDKEKDKLPPLEAPKIEQVHAIAIDKNILPESLGVAIRGIGGQGNLFFGKILSEVALRTPYADTHIVKGDTHGMAQLGGPVISTFKCGKVYSPIPAPKSIDVLVVMEISEVLRPGFLELLKTNGTIIFNNFTALPVNAKQEDYPDIKEIEEALAGYNVVKIDANKVAFDLGDKLGRSANVVVLGLLSTIKPFSLIPEEIWLDALMSVTKNELIKPANILAFKEGRKALVEHL